MQKKHGATNNFFSQFLTTALRHKVVGQKQKKTMKLSEKTALELAEYILNGKKGDLTEFSSQKSETMADGWNEKLIYSDKSMKIFFQWHERLGFEQFVFYSKFFGRIKNSFFSLQGAVGKQPQTRCGIITTWDWKKWHPKDGVWHDIQKCNDIANEVETAGAQTFSDISEVAIYVQKKYKGSLKYEVVKEISLSPNSWVRIKITLPDGREFVNEGSSKKHAANDWARNFKG